MQKIIFVLICCMVLSVQHGVLNAYYSMYARVRGGLVSLAQKTHGVSKDNSHFIMET